MASQTNTGKLYIDCHHSQQRMWLVSVNVVKYQPSNTQRISRKDFIIPEEYRGYLASRIFSSLVKWYQACLCVQVCVCVCLQVSFLKRAAMWSGLSKLVLIWVNTSMFSTTSFYMDTNMNTVNIISNCGFILIYSNYPFQFYSFFIYMFNLSVEAIIHLYLQTEANWSTLKVNSFVF